MSTAASISAAPSSKHLRSRPLVAHWVPYAFLAPYLAITAVFFIYPFLHAAQLTFYQTAGPQSRVWVGLENFLFISGDADFQKALRNTTIFVVGNLAFMIPLSLGLALLLNGAKNRVKGFFRLVFFSPSVVGQIFVGIIFSVIFAPRYGLMNVFLQHLVGWGLDTKWLQEPSMVMPAIVITNLWLYAGFNMIYFLAALQSVDESLVEAARIDGASPVRVFWHVTLPAIRPVVVFVLIIGTIGSFQLFELPYSMLTTSGGSQQGAANGPANSGLFIVTYLYDAAYNLGDLGLASAVGWVLAVIIMTASLIQLRLTGSGGDEGGTS